jgi:hypothetical protein
MTVNQGGTTGVYYALVPASYLRVAAILKMARDEGVFVYRGQER